MNGTRGITLGLIEIFGWIVVAGGVFVFLTLASTLKDLSTFRSGAEILAVVVSLAPSAWTIGMGLLLIGIAIIGRGVRTN